MWSLIVSAVIFYTSANAISKEIFPKCCPNNQSLLKVSDSDLTVSYFCINQETAYNTYNRSISPLVVGSNVLIKYGMPENCDELQMVQLTSLYELKNKEEICYDRLELEETNITLKPYIPKIVALSCDKNDTQSSSEIHLVNQFKKCCPRGQSYDSNFHVCRTDADSTEDWLLSRLEVKDNHIYEVDHGLSCKSGDYGVELREDFFKLKVEGSHLKITNRKVDRSDQELPGEWCVDRDYGRHSLVARVCSRDCAKYGAFCIRKCCPVGYHYRPRRCGSFVSKCTPNTDEVLFAINDYMEVLKREDSAVSDVLGFRSELHCTEGRVVLNKSLERDRHTLDLAGRLSSPISIGYDYCLEAFDMRRCDEPVIVTAVNCFVKSPQTKDFQMSFIMITISSVCLAMTLVVYLSLSELRNLHGRTLICHVSMMLLAFGCLARVQYSLVPDKTICTLLGYGIYFGFVAAFAWLNVMCFDIWWTFGTVRTVQPMRKANAELRRFLWYSLYAWSSSILLTLTMFLFDKYPVANFLDANIGEGMCWFGTLQNSQTDWPHYIFFVVPMGLVTCTNFILWVLTARHCARVKSEVHRLQAGSVGDRAKRRFRVDRAKYVLTGKLWVVMGAGWISELLSTLTSEPQWLWMIIDLINELQGIFIFLILVIKPKLYYLIRKRLGLEKPNAQKNGTSSSARTSSTFLSRALSTDERVRHSLQNNVKSS